MSRDNPSRNYRNYNDLELRDMPEPTMDSRHNFDSGRQKVRVSAGSNQIGDYTASASTASGPPSVTDTLQNARMDAIERAIRELTEDMARNRATFGTLMDELRDTNLNGVPDVLETNLTNGHAAWSSEDRDDVAQMINRVERSVHARFKELARAWSVLGDRLKSLEDVVEDFDMPEISNAGGISPDLEGGIRSLSESSERLERMEDLIAALDRRVGALASSGISSFDTDRLVNKLDHVEKIVADNPTGSFELGPVMASLRDVEAGLRGIGGQVREVDSRTGDVNLLVDGMNERQERLEDIIRAQQSQLDDLLRVVRDDFDFSALQQSGPDKDTISTVVGGAVAERFNGFSTSMQHRMRQLEETVRSAAERPVVTNSDGDVDTSYLNDAVSKIINNQHTLASSIDEWRGQVRDDMTALRTRVDNWEFPSDGPGQEDRFREISDRLRELQTTLPDARNPNQLREPQDGWSRFKLWLYGTTDWYGVSWGGERDDEGTTWKGPDNSSDPDQTYRNEQRDTYDTQRA